MPDRQLAIYVDGAAIHVGRPLRRDRFIRARLRNADPPWRMEELRAAHLRQGAALVAWLDRADVPAPLLKALATVETGRCSSQADVGQSA